MIQKLIIKNYKGFENLKIDELSNINLIGGENNIGKTSFLEAIFTFYDRSNLDVILKPLSWRGVPLSLKNNTPHEVWLPVFNNYNIDKTIEFQFEYKDKRMHEVSINIDKDAVSVLNPEKLAKHDNRNIQQESISDFTLHIQGKIDKELKQDTYLYFINNSIARKVNVLQNKLKPAIFVSQTIRSSAQDVLRFSDIVREGLEDEVLSGLKIIDSRIKSITPLAVSEKESMVHVDIGIGKKIPMYYLGDGVVRLLEYILAILNTKNGIVLIDEIENGLHYSKQKDIWKLILNLASRYNVQVFATTHSKEMTEAFIEFAQANKSVECANYIEFFRNYKTKKVSANSIDIDTLQFKIHNNKNFRGE